MIENYNVSKNPSTSSFVDIKKYLGVASINILAINPNNEKLRQFGWSIPEDADEPSYFTDVERDGKIVRRTRIRILAQIQDLEDKPTVALDFFVSPEAQVKTDGSKCKVIDGYCRTAWVTKSELTSHSIPQYSNGPASISPDYKVCHRGEEELVKFIAKYTNITPLQVFDRASNSWVASKKPGKLTIDNWKALCEGNIQEIAEYVAMQPQNRVKVALGVVTTDDNKTYQTFLNGTYIGNGATPDISTGEYKTARKAIDQFNQDRLNSQSSVRYTFSAKPVSEWRETASEVSDNSENFSTPSVDDEDLPFAM